MNKFARDTILACVIGDGWVDQYGSGGVLHSTAQLDYLTWKRKLLKHNGVKVSEIRLKDNNGYPACYIKFNVSKWNKLLRKILYTPTKDYYSRKLLNRLSAVHIAIWYMDDGGLSQKKRNGVVYANELMINTHTTRDNNDVLIDYFQDVWGIKFTQVLNRGKYRLRCGTKEARKFIQIVKPYVSEVASMQHKLAVIEREYTQVGGNARDCLQS